MDTAKDNRTEMLKRERKDLLERVQVLRDAANGTPGEAMNEVAVMSTASPFHHQMVSMLSPRTSDDLSET
jgi:hypothetical protein